MKPMHRDLDDLLRQNAERQLAGFDWDRQRRIVMHHLDAARARNARRRMRHRIAGAAVLMLVAGCVCLGLVHVMNRDAAVVESVESDRLLASTDPTTILLTGPARLLVCNDPLLAPHALWDQ